ncbi:hypothetical protein CIL05_07280 [Virgibacillus profundi]|uniref:Uncharacterized protein n=1 Tax=Virgibacillus profundi TaxID=2024555 RepID=A0A2A2IGP9_9BACI|nr:hypothetical protein [Virgibacillus profundi]PAV30263.1 hypothetical protein CIL05_07280 [Virgibacillus profundi]PXY54435.1 hypothetical protein CIT14_07365 [Virgibacillus profundi]
MDRKLFNIVQGYNGLANDIYFKLIDELKIDMDVAEELTQKVYDYSDKVLKTGNYVDRDMFVDKWTHLNKKYNELEKYHKFHVIYEYDNGLILGETTSGLGYLIPKDHLEKY